MRGTYEHSGQLGLGPVVVPLAGVIASLILAIVYAYITVYSPVVGFITIIVLLGFAFGLVLAIGLAAKMAKCRNTGFLVLTGLIVGLFALYASWAAFVAVLASKVGADASYLNMLLSPGTVWEFIGLVNDKGWFTVKGSTPSGGFLWVIWGIEALVIVGGGVMGGMIAIQDAVFCEDCGQWCDEVEPAALFGLVDDEQLVNGASNGDLEALAQLPATAPVLGAYLKTEVLQCESCRNTATMQVKLMKVTLDDKGNESTASDDLSPQLLVGPEVVNRLEELASRPPGTGGPEAEKGHEEMHDDEDDEPRAS